MLIEIHQKNNHFAKVYIELILSERYIEFGGTTSRGNESKFYLVRSGAAGLDLELLD